MASTEVNSAVRSPNLRSTQRFVDFRTRRFFALLLFFALLRLLLRSGTFAPFSRASLSPIAIACFRLRTVRPDPLFRVPFFRRRIADSTFLDADFPYLAISTTPPDSNANGAPRGSGETGAVDYFAARGMQPSSLVDNGNSSLLLMNDVRDVTGNDSRLSQNATICCLLRYTSTFEL